MVDINLYQPGVCDETIQFPTEWNDLTLEELHLVSGTFLSSWDNESAAKAQLLVSILQHRTPGISKLADKLNIEDVAMNAAELVDFIFKENDLTKQPYPKLELSALRSLMVLGPASNFYNLTVGEYEDAEQYAFEFNEEPCHESLAKLASVLYRKPGVSYYSFNKTTGQHVPYDSEKLVPHFNKLPPPVLYTIYLWYTGCKAELPKLFPTVFEGGEGGTPDPTIFTKCIHAGAGERNGTRDRVRMLLLKEFFFDMELEAQKVKELKKQANAK